MTNSKANACPVSEGTMEKQFTKIYFKVIFDLDLKGCLGTCQMGRLKKMHQTAHFIRNLF